MPLHHATPLIESPALGSITGRAVHLKMECAQDAGSFKIRGVGALCERYVANGCRHLIASSGGNAGYAVAYAARRLGVAATIVVPETTDTSVRERMRALGAQVIVHGAVWDVAHAHALSLCAQPHSHAEYVHPFDHPRIWQGNASLIHEAAQSLPHAPDAVVVSVGGGGLFCGVMQGLRDVAWDATRVLAVETQGAASLAAALQANALVELPEITSIATTLGARKVAQQAFDEARNARVSSVVVSDAAAIDACVRFADDHRALVEPACGAALALAYANHPALGDARSVLVIVCGGIGISLDKLAAWKRNN